MQIQELYSDLEQLRDRYRNRFERDLTTELQALGRHSGIAAVLASIRTGDIDIDALDEYSDLSRDVLQLEEDARLISRAWNELERLNWQVELCDRYGVPPCQVDTASQRADDLSTIAASLQTIAAGQVGGASA